MRIGVIGLGYWGSRHVRVLSSMRAVEVVSGYDVDPRRGQSLERVHGNFRSARSLDELLAGVDGVVIATGASTHFSVTEAALRAGAHVLVEKPFVLKYADGLHLASLARSLGRLLMVGHTFIFDPAVRAVRDAVQGGLLGRVVQLDSRRINVESSISDCDVIWDLAPHDLSILNFVLGTGATSVRAQGSSSRSSRVLDDVSMELRYGPSGPDVTVRVSWNGPEKVRCLRVVGEVATITYDDSAGDRLITLDSAGCGLPWPSAVPPEACQQLGQFSAAEEQETLLLEDQHFVDCIKTGQAPVSGVFAGLEVTAGLEAASRAVVSGEEAAVVRPPRGLDVREGFRLVSPR